MIEITNKDRSPMSLMVKSNKAPRSFTTLTIPGLGAGHNVRVIPDEFVTEEMERFVKRGLISTRYIPQSK